MSALTQYIEQANKDCKRGRRTPFQMIDQFKLWVEKNTCKEYVGITTDSISGSWGFWDWAGWAVKFDGYCQRFGFTPIGCGERVFPYVTDGPYSMIPLDVADEIIERLDTFLAEFGERLEKES